MFLQPYSSLKVETCIWLELCIYSSWLKVARVIDQLVSLPEHELKSHYFQVLLKTTSVQFF